MSKRTIAVGDVHGCSRALAALIRAVEPTPADLWISLGDVIDRGPDSKGVVDHLIDLQRRSHLVTILGNHEQMLLDAWARRDQPADSNPALRAWLRYGGLATLDSYGPSAMLEDLPEDHLEFLENCVGFHETDRHIFVHANYQPDIPLDRQTALMLRWESLREFQPGPHRSGKIAVVGHTPQKNGIPLNLGHLLDIDTYCYGGGWLTAVDVDSGAVWQADQGGRVRSWTLESGPP